MQPGQHQLYHKPMLVTEYLAAVVGIVPLAILLKLQVGLFMVVAAAAGVQAALVDHQYTEVVVERGGQLVLLALGFNQAAVGEELLLLGHQVLEAQGELY
jgi:hypothetical protein